MCNTRLCFSMSDFHPKTWNPAWQVSSILTALLSFMTSNDFTTGSINSSQVEKVAFARQSRIWNNSNKKFREQFPDEVGNNELFERARQAREAVNSRPKAEREKREEMKQHIKLEETAVGAGATGAKWKWTVSVAVLGLILASRFVTL